ncbi:MAG: diguanylate cyclase [Acidobacteriia bacterium]|nr:diguanylate cyclase [Terriglobia bacterium]
MSNGKEGTSEYWLDLFVDTLKELDQTVQGAFLQRFLMSLASVDVCANESVIHWQRILARRSQLAEKLGRPVTLRTASVDYFGELCILRNPVLLEYEELKKLRHDATTDPLTGLNNRRMFEEYLGQEIGRCTRYGSSFALLLVDLHEFKGANDTYGHATGDEILRCVARASVGTIRGSDIPCRTGGDEFAILLPEAGRSGAQALAERIARKFEESARPLAPSTPIGIDYGIALFPEDGHDAISLFASADKSLYVSKQKAYDQSARRTVPPLVTASQIDEVTRPVKAEASLSDDRPPLIPSALAGIAGTGEEVRGSDAGPHGRRCERIRLEGTPALGIVRLGLKSRTVRVLDVSPGGVCLLADQDDLPEYFPVRLQLPLLPENELTLHRVYSLPLPSGKRRVGCSFTPIPEPSPASTLRL